MTHSGRRAALLGLLALGGCAVPGTVGRNDTNPLEGGIGGTGIVGTLTDFGSLVVNGRRVDLTSNTRIEDAFGPLAPDALRRGHSLTVEADADRGRFTARRVALTEPLVGPLAQGPGGLTVAGVPVRLVRGAPVAEAPRVRVSGLWDGEIVVASRIAPAPAGPDVIAGVPRRGRIGGVPLVGVGAAPGRFATLLGRAEEGRYTVLRVRGERFREPGRLRLLSVEGYLDPVAARPGFEVAGLGHSFDPRAQLDALARGRSVIEGRYAGDFVAARGVPLPEDLPRARALLTQRLAGTVREVPLR